MSQRIGERSVHFPAPVTFNLSQLGPTCWQNEADVLLGELRELRYDGNVKVLSVNEAQGQLSELIAQAHRGVTVILKDGDKKVWLETREPLSLDTDNPELESELLKAIDGPFTAYSGEEMRHIGEGIIKRIKGG